MEGVRGEVINVGGKIVNVLKGELAEAYKTIAEKEAEVQRLLEKIAVLEKRQSDWDGGREPEVKPIPILERKAEEIIPKECWGVVFRNLDAEDLVSCLQVCKTFKKLLDLKEFKEKWGFHLVLPMLFPYLKKSDPDIFHILDIIRGRGCWQNLYNARLVCQSWRHSIDKYASEVHGTQNILPRTTKMPLLTCFRTLDDIDEFQERFGECNTNPFPSRSVYIGNPEEEDSDAELYDDYDEDYHAHKAQKQLQKAYIREVGELLKQFGKHIFRLMLYFESEHMCGPNVTTLCKLVKRITLHLPNLKELHIRNISAHEEYEDDEDDVVTYFEDNPLAALPKLRTLSIRHLDKKLKEYLLSVWAPQLTRLETRWSENLLNQAQMQQLKNVSKLWLAVSSSRTPSDAFESFRFLESPLKHLKLTCQFGPSGETWNADKILRDLKHLPIELLEIQLQTWSYGLMKVAEAGIDSEECDNASIKTLIIHTHQHNPNATNFQISFNFLQALTKLENLELKFSGKLNPTTRTSHPGELVPEVVKLNDYLFGEEGTDLPYQSNVWEKVPSLKTLTLTRFEAVNPPKLERVYENDDDFISKSIFTKEKYEKIRIQN